MSSEEAISSDHLQRLHPRAIEDPSEISALLQTLVDERITLRQGMNRQIQPETATLIAVTDDCLVLRTRDFEPSDRPNLLLNFSVDGRPYSFASARLDKISNGRIRAEKPRIIYCTERRDRARRSANTQSSAPSKVLVIENDRMHSEAQIADWSPDGLGVRLPPTASRFSGRLRVRFINGERAGLEADADVRYSAPEADRPGWIRIGLALSGEGPPSHLPLVRRDEVLPGRLLDRARRRWSTWAQGVSYASTTVIRSLAARKDAEPEIQIVRYRNEKGERLVGLVDSCGDPRGATAVVISPAWGRTKETLLPLARTIVETFRAAERSVAVLRFDGIRKRGESHNDPECLEPGADHHHFTFSQGARDIEATVRFLEGSSEFSPSKTILVTFSAASIDGRVALARDSGGRIDGWVCVVGSADLQSMMRVISGGVDYVGGIERGIRFGLQEILGVQVDIDRAGDDAIANRLAFLEDARRDLSSISQPIAWFHGAYDAWMDLDRIRDVLSRGDTSQRKLIVIPTGHQLKSSRQALEVFQSIAVEIGRMALDVELPPQPPQFVDLDLRRLAEKRRRPVFRANLRKFWHDYLVGPDGILGIELMTNTANYRALMEREIEALRIEEGNRILDLGAGTGAFPLQLAEWGKRPLAIEIVELDFVRDAIRRARQRLEKRVRSNELSLAYLEVDLDLRNGAARIPIKSGSCDRVLASLLLSYVKDPFGLLREIHRVLRPGTTLVISTLKKDADISKIYMEGLSELHNGLAKERFGPDWEEQLEGSTRSFLNDAARLLNLEEEGAFQFWEPEELAALVRAAGFSNVSVRPVFGTPPQAVMVAAARL